MRSGRLAGTVFAMLLVVTTAAPSACAAGSSDSAATARPRPQAGITFPAWWYDEYDTRFSDRALGQIADTGAGWVVLVPTWYQRTRTTATIAPERRGRTPSDASLRRAIATAHRQSLKVMLKPHVDLRNDSIDRATIRPADPAAWFRSYTAFISHYADLAADAGVEQLAVGTELAGTSRGTARWRAVIGEVRSRYRGPLTYAANFDELARVGFWDALDLIGVDAYWPLAARPTTDVATLRRAWRPVVDELARAAARWDRRVVFTEAGYASVRGTVTAPYDWTVSARRSDAEQAAGYRALLETFWAKPWFAGVHWWMWDDFPGGGEDQRLDYTPRGKPAEQVLRTFF